LASEATGVSGIAERYAAALFDLADERRTFDEVASDLRQLRTMLAASVDLSRLVRSPILTRGEQGKAIAARPLSETQLALLSDQLRRSAGRRVSVDARVDPGLIGGMIVRVGSRMVDGSIKSKLQRLQLAMKGIG